MSRRKEQRKSLLEDQINNIMREADAENRSNRDSSSLSMKFAVGHMVKVI